MATCRAEERRTSDQDHDPKESPCYPEIALMSYSATFIRLLGEPSTGSKQLLRIVLMVF